MKNSQKGRIMTLVVRVEQDDYPNWVLDAHLASPQNGVRVLSISEGDLAKEYEEVINQLEHADIRD